MKYKQSKTDKKLLDSIFKKLNIENNKYGGLPIHVVMNILYKAIISIKK